MGQGFLDDHKAYSLAGTEQEVNFITNVLNLPEQATILDLYCGYGRHAIELAKKGYVMTGIDGTEDFLKLARQAARESHVKIQFCHCDMRQLSFTNQFDAIINMFAAFGYFSDEENSKIVSTIARALKPKGFFLIDLLNRDWMLQNNINRYWRHPNGEYVLSYKVELHQGIATMKRQLINQVTGKKMEVDFLLRAYSLAEMIEMLTATGMSIQKVYGGFDGRPYGEETPRMIILAKKE